MNLKHVFEIVKILANNIFLGALRAMRDLGYTFDQVELEKLNFAD